MSHEIYKTHRKTVITMIPLINELKELLKEKKKIAYREILQFIQQFISPIKIIKEYNTAKDEDIITLIYKKNNHYEKTQIFFSKKIFTHWKTTLVPRKIQFHPPAEVLIPPLNIK